MNNPTPQQTIEEEFKKYAKSMCDFKCDDDCRNCQIDHHSGFIAGFKKAFELLAERKCSNCKYGDMETLICENNDTACMFCKINDFYCSCWTKKDSVDNKI
jgi:hypothetical protein